MKKVLIVVAGFLVLTAAAFAATKSANTNTVAPTIQLSATIQKAVSLTLSTGTTAAAHCAVSGGTTTDFQMNFGNVDALGINAGNCNKIAPVTPGTTNAVYWSDYTVTPIYTSHQTFTNTTVTAYVSTDFGAPHNVLILRSTTATSSTAPVLATDMTAMSTTAATPDTIGAAGVASGTALTRFIGVGVTPANGATVLQGAQTATVTFTLTVQ